MTDLQFSSSIWLAVLVCPLNNILVPVMQGTLRKCVRGTFLRGGNLWCVSHAAICTLCVCEECLDGEKLSGQIVGQGEAMSQVRDEQM